jgi:hypothetical protein
MRSKISFILVIVAVLTILAAYMLLFQAKEVMDPSTGFPTGEMESVFTTFKKSWDSYKQVQGVDYEGQRLESERLKSQLAFVEAEINDLEANLINIEAERAEKEILMREEKTDEINQKANDLRQQISELEYQISLKQNENQPSIPSGPTFATSTSDLIYSLLLDGIEGTTTAVISFVGENSDNGYYTVKLVGYLDSLTVALDNITSNMEAYDISVCNCSLRQIYGCYSDMRDWDKATLLNWFSNNYVTGSGTVGELTGGTIMETIQTNGVLGSYTFIALALERDRDLEEIGVRYDAKIKSIEEDRIAAIMTAYKYPDKTKVSALLQDIKDYYDGLVADENAQRAIEEAGVLEIYNARVEALQKPVVEDNVVEGEEGEDVEVEIPIDETLAHPELLIYTLDITFSVYDR